MSTKKFFVSTALVVVLAAAFIFLPLMGGNAKAADPITLSFVSFVPLADKVEYQACKQMFIDKVNERAKGELVIKVRGGPEVIPPFDLGVATQKGAIDMAMVPTAFFESLVPGADSTKLSAYDAQEERKNGIFEYIADMYKKSGLRYLGRAASNDGFFYVQINKKTEKPEDFKGLKLGGSTAFHGFYRELGASVVTLPPPEYHSAMDRGVIDGVVSSLYVGYQMGVVEVTKYIIDTGFYRTTLTVPMNLKKWESLPKHLQEIIMDCMIQYEKEYVGFEAKARVDTMEKIKAKGVKAIHLSPEVEKWYLNAAREGSWKYAQQRFPGDLIPNLRKRITKP
ncbi:MAG: TRAP transporter substrate-binding protein DctP [Pseudomonadota bacterium]